MKIKDFILSKENIYLAIYEARSYVFEYNLLSKNDKELLNKLSDPFNEILINQIIEQVMERIDLILKTDELFDVQVFFKPKSINEENEIDFRPIHTAKLTEMIAMVAMLHVLIYEIPDDRNNFKINLSNYSRLIPNNFYGNRVSTRPEELFKKWNESYKKYTQKANEYFTTFHKTKEYNYEIKLDLIQFFPSVDPAYVYKYLTERLPVSLEASEDLLKKIIFKLLVCNIKNIESDEAQKRYYGKTIEGPHFTKGIAQGLPQSYFFGNISMIEISKLFDDRYKGKAVYYVDDSYIYTNEIDGEDSFKKSIKELNDAIKKKFRINNKIRKDFNDRGTKYPVFYKGIYSKVPMIKIHEKDKSSHMNIADAKKGEIYLHLLSREASCMGTEINNAFSEEEDKTLLNKTTALIEAINRQIDELNDNPNSEEENNNYKDKLIRYRKFFKYRALKQRLKVEKTPLNKDLTEILIGGDVSSEKYEEEIQKKIDKIRELINNSNKKSSELGFFSFSKVLVDKYKNDIWQVAVDMCIDYHLVSKELLLNYIELVDDIFYKEGLKECSFINRYYSSFLHQQDVAVLSNCYDSLDMLTKQKMGQYIKLHDEVMFEKFEGVKFNVLTENIFDSFDICSKDFINYIKYVDSNSCRLKRMFINAVYSRLFKVSPSDDFLLSCYDKKGISYGTLRILLYLRNPNCDINNFFKWDIDLTLIENRQKIDYSILEVLQVYQKYVKQPDRIDDLILVHRYTCDVWKNGAKHLYFYTLHNQEHAIDLVKNIVKIIKTFSYFKISEYDYYLLFIACYLHDVSMVRTASANDFLLDQSSDIITSELTGIWNDKNDISSKKQAVIKTYKRVDDFFENKIRSNHGRDSSEEIRTRNDLFFLEQSVRETVAEISESHTMDVRDIYFSKGDAQSKLISLKFNKILLRLADLLDMSEHRVSKPILDHNLDNISNESAFHWISHLLTSGYELFSEYKTSKGFGMNYLEPDAIEENITLKIFVNLSQLSKSPNASCHYMEIDEESVDNFGFDLIVIDKNNKRINKCISNKCNFLCRWFNIKNKYLIQEINSLNAYLDRVPKEDRFYNTSVRIKVEIVNPTALSDSQFDILEKTIQKKSK